MELKDNLDNRKIKLGIFSKFLIGTSIMFYTLSFFNKNFNLIYGNMTMFSIFWFEIYRLITGIFVIENFIELALNVLVIITIINFLENKDGSSKTFIRFITIIFVFQCFLIIIHLILYLYNPIILSYFIKPIPSIGIAFLVKHILLTENKRIILVNGIKLNDRWLLICLFISFILININEFKIESLFCLYFGFLMCKSVKLLDYPINEEKIISFEKNDNYKSLFNLEGWIFIEECYFNNISLEDNKNEKEDDIEIIDNIEI